MGAIIANDGRGGGGASYRAHRSGIGRKAEGRSAVRRIQSSGRKIKNLLDLLHASVWEKARRKCFFQKVEPPVGGTSSLQGQVSELSSSFLFPVTAAAPPLFFFPSPEDTAHAPKQLKKKKTTQDGVFQDGSAIKSAGKPQEKK